MGTVLGEIYVYRLIHFAAIWILTTIFSCYAIAVSLGHVPLWLPMISACGDTPPEQYIFRYGLLSGALLLVVLALYIYTADFPFSDDPTNVFLGVFGGLCLGVVAICADNENNTWHTTSAIIFFVMEDILMIRVTVQGHSVLSRKSLIIKATCTIVGCLSTILRFMVMFNYIPAVAHVSPYLDFPTLAFVEWSNTMAMVVFHWSFATDFINYSIAAWKDSSGEVDAAREGVVSVGVVKTEVERDDKEKSSFL